MAAASLWMAVVLSLAFALSRGTRSLGACLLVANGLGLAQHAGYCRSNLGSLLAVLAWMAFVVVLVRSVYFGRPDLHRGRTL